MSTWLEVLCTQLEKAVRGPAHGHAWQCLWGSSRHIVAVSASASSRTAVEAAGALLQMSARLADLDGEAAGRAGLARSLSVGFGLSSRMSGISLRQTLSTFRCDCAAFSTGK